MNINFNELLFILILYFIYLYLIKNKENNINTNITESKLLNNNIQKINTDNTINKNKTIIFDYNLENNNIQYKDHKNIGFNNNIIYPNTWIDKIDPITNKPIYKSRYDIEKFYETKTAFTYELDNIDNYKVYKMNGVIDPLDDNNGKTIKQIYDNSFVNFKIKTPIKKIINNNENETTIIGASKLSMLIPDTWIYENENPENGGLIKDGLYAYDNELLGQNAVF